MKERLKAYLTGNPKLKKLIYSLMMSDVETRPRLWLRALQFAYTKRGKDSKIYSSVRKDITPFNRFELGKRSVIESYCCVNNAVGDVVIGDNCRIGLHATIIGPVSIGNYSMIGQCSMLSALDHGFEDVTRPIVMQKVTTREIVIEDDVWVGANCTITSGVRLGKHSVIAAGAVVTKDVPPYSLAAGVPAKVIKRYNEQTGRWEKA